MNRIVTIGSITNAQKAKRALLANGIRARLIKNDSQSRSDGCVYGLEISEGDLLGACSVLRRIGLEYRVL